MGSIRRALPFLVAASVGALAACGVLLGTDEEASSGSSSGAPKADGGVSDDASSATGGSNPDGGGDAEAGAPVGLSCGIVAGTDMGPPVCGAGQQCCLGDGGVGKCITPLDSCVGLRLACDLSFGCDVGVGCSLAYGALDGQPKGTICGQSSSPSLDSYWMCSDAAPCPGASSICRAGPGFPQGFFGCDPPPSNN